MILGKSACLAAVGFLISAGTAWAGIIRDDVPDASYQALGNDPNYASVGRVNSSIGTTTGVLISQDWFLTAGHVVWGNYQANTAVSFNVGSNSYSSAEIVMHPGYVNGSAQNGFDLALVRLSSPVTNVTPASLYTGNGELGQVGTSVGFGQGGTGTTGATSSTGTKRAGTNVIDIDGATYAGWSPSVLLSDFDRPGTPANLWGSPTPTPLEYLVAPGDSGSGVFIDVGNGPELAAIASFVLFNGDGLNYGYGDRMGAIRVSAELAWISEVTGVPEPSSLVLAAVGVALVTAARIRRRRRAAA